MLGPPKPRRLDEPITVSLEDLIPPIPSTALTRIRQRLGIDVFQRFFEQIVNLCQEAGLLWGCELYFDATADAWRNRRDTE